MGLGRRYFGLQPKGKLYMEPTQTELPNAPALQVMGNTGGVSVTGMPSTQELMVYQT